MKHHGDAVCTCNSKDGFHDDPCWQETRVSIIEKIRLFNQLRKEILEYFQQNPLDVAQAIEYATNSCKRDTKVLNVFPADTGEAIGVVYKYSWENVKRLTISTRFITDPGYIIKEIQARKEEKDKREEKYRLGIEARERQEFERLKAKYET
jgi:hypothetical protein